MTFEAVIVGLLFVFAVVLASFAIGLTRALRGVDLRTVAEEPRGLSPGARAPTVELPTTAGEAVRLPAVERATFLMFASATCHDCHAVAPIVDQVRSGATSPVDVHIIVAGDIRAVRKFEEDTGVQAPVLTDPNGTAARSYGARRVPLGVFVGANGLIEQSSALTTANAGPLMAEFLRRASMPAAT